MNETYKDDEVTFHALWSNECIELWFVLHFIFLTSNILRTDYIDKLTIFLGKKYQKNDKELFDKLKNKKDGIPIAIKNAKKLMDIHKDNTPSDSVPATMVYEFFEMYKDYLI